MPLQTVFRPSTGPRYVIQQTLIVRSSDPDAVLAVSQRVSEMVAAGKPKMIAAATANARAAAEQFARDSRSALGGIRLANQGVFVLLPRDRAPGVSRESQLHKTVRVVSTVQYFLR